MKWDNQLIDKLNSFVLIWLATVDNDGMPNVSPKEVFFANDEAIYIADIASPSSVNNILESKNVCISSIDILEQKGYKIKGQAQILDNSMLPFKQAKQLLVRITEGKYPFKRIIMVTPTQIDPIVAPSYFMFPNQTIDQKVQLAKTAYGLKTINDLD